MAPYEDKYEIKCEIKKKKLELDLVHNPRIFK